MKNNKGFSKNILLSIIAILSVSVIYLLYQNNIEKKDTEIKQTENSTSTKDLSKTNGEVKKVEEINTTPNKPNNQFDETHFVSGTPDVLDNGSSKIKFISGKITKESGNIDGVVNDIAQATFNFSITAGTKDVIFFNADSCHQKGARPNGICVFWMNADNNQRQMTQSIISHSKISSNCKPTIDGFKIPKNETCNFIVKSILDPIVLDGESGNYYAYIHLIGSDVDPVTTLRIMGLNQIEYYNYESDPVKMKTNTVYVNSAKSLQNDCYKKAFYSVMQWVIRDFEIKGALKSGMVGYNFGDTVPKTVTISSGEDDGNRRIFRGLTISTGPIPEKEAMSTKISDFLKKDDFGFIDNGKNWSEGTAAGGNSLYSEYFGIVCSIASYDDYVKNTSESVLSCGCTR